MRPPSLAVVALFPAFWASPATAALDPLAENAAKAFLASVPVRTVAGPVPGRPTDVDSARAAVLGTTSEPRRRFQGRDRCPPGCARTGVDTSAWYGYGGLERLRGACQETMLLDFALINPVDAVRSQVAISACTADFDPSSDKVPFPGSEYASSCGFQGAGLSETSSLVQLRGLGSPSAVSVAAVTSALEQLQHFSTIHDSTCNETIRFSYAGSVAVGVYSGAGLARQGVLSQVLERLIGQVQSDGHVDENVLVQMCGNSSRYTLGITANTKGELGAVQRTVQSWKNGSCSDTGTAISDWHTVAYLSPSRVAKGSSPPFNTTRSSSPAIRGRPASIHMSKRADPCSTIQVHSGDSCSSLAAQCGISPAKFTEYNSESSLCSGLMEGQHVCCSAGKLPDFTPKPGADGYCHSYLVKAGDSCSSLAAANGISNAKIEEFNKQTWGWNGCERLFADYKICLSSGYPPMPAPVANAVCGPQVNGTERPPPGTELGTLNQCPLNACCNTWGQCGTTAMFCTISESETGAPGTAAPGENGCISNCGTDIVASDAPGETVRIAYFEAYNWQRPCLNSPINRVNTSAYTHIHFSFITLNEDFSVSLAGVSEQFMLFRAMSNIKKIVSLGGWAFSTDPATYAILRNAVSNAQNRRTLVTNVVEFLDNHNLDGIDWDWEYPGEPDIPGIPTGTEDETIGFFLLLAELKERISAGKTVSVTAPASYWYLQQFPIKAMSIVMDYLVFMTYDLHGQWDYSSKHAADGCVSYDQGLGNCLRSHVNLTETLNSLSMITKAGVPSNMIAVGVSSYGRSFQMTKPGCWGEQCTYTGPSSGAVKGRCTGTAGYIADYEIGEILAQDPTAQTHFDNSSYSNIVVYQDTQWIAYMDKDNKATREALYPSLNFLGTADWAVDLQSDGGDELGSGSSDQTVYIDPDIWTSVGPRVTALPGVTLIWPPMPLSTPTTITFPPWTTSVSYSSLTTRTSTLLDGSLTTFPAYVYVSWLTVLTIPPVTTTAIPVWDVTLSHNDTDGSILLISSIQPPPFTVTITPVVGGSTSVIGASETTTVTPVPIIWGTETYTPPVETQTHGKGTTTMGGVVLPPVIITVTPNPHPTTPPVPGSTDPVLNFKPHSWTSGAKAEPTAKTGCPGCGTGCVLFCNSLCPFCPPGIFSNPHSGGNSVNPGNGDPDDDDNDDDDEDGDYTVVFSVVDDDFSPVHVPSAEEIDTADALLDSWLLSAFAVFRETSTTTTPATTEKPPPTPTTTNKATPPPAPSHRASCAFWDSIYAWTFEVYNIEGWAEGDHGQGLHDNENGCGALTGWDWHEPTGDKRAFVFFVLPFWMADGCVERAIASAGGPKIQCQKQPFLDGPHEMRVNLGQTGAMQTHPANGTAAMPEKAMMRPSFPPWTERQTEAFRAFYEARMPQSDPDHSYIPMNWGVASTTTLP